MPEDIKPAVEPKVEAPAPDTKVAPATAITKASGEIEPAPKDSQTTTEPKPDAVKYELKLPEKSPLDAKHVDGIVAFAKARGLSAEQAQALLERENESATLSAKSQEALMEAHKPGGSEWMKRVNGYESVLKADREIGGDALPKNVELAARVVNRFFTPEFKKALDETGFGSHPELVRGLVRMGKSMAEDTLVPGGTRAHTEKKSAAQIMYPSHK